MTIVNIQVENDSDFYRVFQYVAVVSGVPVDLTGATMEMMLRRHAENNAVVMRLGTDTGEIKIVDPPSGKFTLLITQYALEHLGLGDFDHSNIMTRNGLKTKMWSGLFTNVAGATR
jgi:hypothetical protein